jgi:hypothetical protein
MCPLVPHDALAGALEIVCYGFTVAAALLSWFVSLRL